MLFTMQKCKKIVDPTIFVAGDGEELIIPGDREEMGKFIDSASHNAKLQVEIILPKANVHLPSKHLYELIYNRSSLILYGMGHNSALD